MQLENHFSLSITSDLPCCSFKQQQRQHHPSHSLPRLSAFCFFTKTPPSGFLAAGGKSQSPTVVEIGVSSAQRRIAPGRGGERPHQISLQSNRSNSCLDIYLGKHKCQCQSGAAGKVRRSPVTRFNIVTWCTAPLQTLPQCGGLVPLGEEKVASHTHTHTLLQSIFRPILIHQDGYCGEWLPCLNILKRKLILKRHICIFS